MRAPPIRRLAIPDVVEITPRRFADSRGWLAEVYSRRALAAAGLAADFVQANQSFSRAAHTLRGLHFQRPPHAQRKLVWAVTGAAFDVAVDLRRGSPHFGRSVAVTLSAGEGNQLLVPAGFAHGFLTLAPDTIVQYLVDMPYVPESEGGIRFDDPQLAIPWPLAGAAPVLSPRDLGLPFLADLDTPFAWVPEGPR
ncbi:MAG TPA: dTDP-4-dehydrorhamnose 3,5-epimerase [Bauldia sp.]|nr:dTDP-4-dehydrorhamnose 3,5-epimerase [Bauldia sp.]